MENIMIFIKKYKVYLIIGGILLVSAIILFIITTQVSSGGYSMRTRNIMSPYPIQENEITIDMRDVDISTKQKGEVLKVISYNIEDLESFVSEFYEIDKELDFTDEVYVQQGKDNYFSFTPSTGVFSLFSSEGIASPIDITSEKGIREFFSKYLGIGEISITEEEKGDESTKYNGKYVLKNIEIGSSYIEGNAFKVEVNTQGQIRLLALLAIKDENIEKYQYMPLVRIEELISNKVYPKMIGSNVIEERFYYRPLPYEITELYVKDGEQGYLFNDAKSGLIVPTYILDGDGKIKNIEGEEFWAETKLFICSVDPSYLTKRVDSIQEESKEEEGAPNLPPR